ncbi:MAG: sodium/proline symporter PutP [Pseudomonadales bacterium]|nr:sodium/proline symporter PutP [Pseudomonadales bacterium]
MSPILYTFAAYLGLTLLIGLIAWRRTQEIQDYLLGGRRLGPWTAALSAGASDMSGWLLLGLPGYAYGSGLNAFWLAGGLWIGTWLNWRLMAKRLRQFSKTFNDSLTLPSYFENRFADSQQLIRPVSAAFIILFFLFYTASGLVAGGKLFHEVFEIDYHLAVILGAIVIVLYTAIGGFLAVSWTDVIQGLLMAAALIMVPLIAFQQQQPDLNIELYIQQNEPLFRLFYSPTGEPLTLIAILSLLAWGLGYFGQPHILARFKAISSPQIVPLATKVAVTWTGITLVGGMAVGIIGNGFFNETLPDGEKVFIQLVSVLFNPYVAGLLLAAILAAIMSTADSQLLVSTSALTQDLYQRFTHQEMSDQKLIRMSRLAVVVIAIIAALIAQDPESGVLDLVAYAWAGFGASFGPTLLLSLYWKRMNKVGALAGIVFGGVTVVVWKQLEGGWFDLYEIVPGIAASTLAIVIVSLVTPKPPQEIVAKIDGMVGLLKQKAPTLKSSIFSSDNYP